jgi:hypothetical protein
LLAPGLPGTLPSTVTKTIQSTDSASVFSHVLDLVARREFDAARTALEAELWRDPDNPPLRQQLADVLAMSGHVAEAADVLSALAESFVEKGQTAKAIATLKRVQVLDPSRGDEDGRLARLLRSREDERRAELFSMKRPRAAPAPEDPDGDAGNADELIETVFGRRSPMDGTATVDEKTTEVALLKELPPGEILEPDFDASDASSPAHRATLAGSPLFGSFSAEELEAVIRGLRLLAFEPGDIVVSEGEAGGSLFVVTTGTVKAFVRDAGGRSRRVRQLSEGSFFGEVSILTGHPRSATIVAATSCELLELDRPTLDQILSTQPRVLAVLQAFSAARVSSAAEALARRGE